MTLWIEAWLGDLRIALRTLRRQPVFSLAAVCTFALGIGAATAIFSVAYGIAFRPLPYPTADRLVRIYEANTGQEPLGQPFHIPSFGFSSFVEVVGVVADVQFAAVGREPVLDIFVPWMQAPLAGAVRLVVRATDDAAAIAPAVREAVVAEHAATGIHRVTPLETLADRTTAPARVTSQLVAGLGLLALLLAPIGVYGGLSTLVTARAHETAVRIALGASRTNTLWRTLAQGLTPVIAGAIGGIAAAVALISSVRSLLFQIDRIHVGALLSGAVVLLTVALLACLAPALRAAWTDPIGVLRGD